jgi:hypothetical protein
MTNQTRHKEQDPSNDGEKSQPDGVRKKGTNTAMGEESKTAPENHSEVSSAQKNVWENENASAQDKSYSFDEDVTAFDWEDDVDFDSGQESRT